jgi:succinate dehydrogenase/fumarate reductase iron-sulfur protein
MLNQNIKVKCFRFSPPVDKEPVYQTYEVPKESYMSVLNVLDYIYENLDATLAYYSCCRRGICGRCTVMVNGKAQLSCLDIVEGDVTIEPLRGRKVVKDLVVDI